MVHDQALPYATWKKIELKGYDDSTHEYYKNLIKFLNTDFYSTAKEYKTFKYSQKGNDIFNLFFVHDLIDLSSFETTGKLTSKSRGGFAWGYNYAENIALIPNGYYSRSNSKYNDFIFHAQSAVLQVAMWNNERKQIQLSGKEFELLTGLIRLSLLYALDKDRSTQLNIFITDSKFDEVMDHAIRHNWILP